MAVILIQGFFLQASLILALGAQNIFVLNSGLHKQRHLLVALVSSLCDTLLVFIGVLGVASFFIRFPILKFGLGIIGVGFLFFYGILKLKEAKQGQTINISNSQIASSKQVILTSMGFSLLNPHVYLDTVVLIGGYSSKFNSVSERFFFGLGASLFSTFWFFALALLAAFASRILKNAQTMRWVALISGAILIGLAFKLGLDVAAWVKEI